MSKVIDGTDLLVNLGGKALAYANNCKISTSAETTERLTKELATGKWAEKSVKKLSETVTSDGLIIDDSNEDMPGYDELRQAMLACEPVEVSYNLRGTGRNPRTDGGYKGKYIITSLEANGQAGEDASCSVTFESCGPVQTLEGGLHDPISKGSHITAYPPTEAGA